jgi:hypothetical protein
MENIMQSTNKMAGGILALLAGLMGVASAHDNIDRSILPIQPPVAAPITEMDARNARVAKKPIRIEKSTF